MDLIKLLKRKTFIKLILVGFYVASGIPFSPSYAGFSSLMEASVSGNPTRIETMKRLLDQGANPNEKTEDGLTALMLASNAGDSDVVAWLLDQGAKPNEVSKEGLTALYLAAQNNYPEAARLLYRRGALIEPATQGITHRKLLLATALGIQEYFRSSLETLKKNRESLYPTDVPQFFLDNQLPTPLLLAFSTKQLDLFLELLFSGVVDFQREIRVAIDYGEGKAVSVYLAAYYLILEGRVSPSLIHFKVRLNPQLEAQAIADLFQGSLHEGGCPVCFHPVLQKFEPFKNFYISDCGHPLCQTCVDACTVTQPLKPKGFVCPNCRGKFDPERSFIHDWPDEAF